MTLTWETQAHKALIEAAPKFAEKNHLRELLKDEERNGLLTLDLSGKGLGMVLDGTRQLVSKELLGQLEGLYKEMKVGEGFTRMAAGEKINSTEGRAVMHWALRAKAEDGYQVDGKPVVPEVLSVREKIEEFSARVRSGAVRGVTGKPLTTVLSVGIGGSYLGVEFVHEALKNHPKAKEAAKGRTLKFVANVDPTDMAGALEGLDLESTLVIIVSKTFTTAETMMNAKSLKETFLAHFKSSDQAKVIRSHFCAVSTNIKEVSAFGIAPENVFGFWDWVGGRFSVCSAVGVLPLCLQYDKEVVSEFLDGARVMDRYVYETRDEPLKNPAALMGLLSMYNSEFLGIDSIAVLPYAQALLRFPAHIQQLTMESNGKGVTIDGKCLGDMKRSGEIFFGEPGTNGQHSFYQLMHQGKVVASEFIGYAKSQTPYRLTDAQISNHDELMCNFFAQPDALALGKTIDQCRAENIPEPLLTHKTFPGNRPSLSLLFLDEPNAFNLGALLSLYENRTAVVGFLRNLNSFDQWGVELGKVLAKDIRNHMVKGGATLPAPTLSLLSTYMKNRS